MSEKTDIAKRKETSPERSRRIPTVTPQVDIYENNEEILLYADMPGLSKEDISINLENGKLFLSGRRQLVSSGSVLFEEFGEVEYSRTFSVPQGIDMGKVNAELKEGVLRLHLPKSEAVKPRQIQIKTA
jgi:HSP20 family molecular chaperone IbpA